MSATALTPVSASPAGIDPGMAAVDAANGNIFPNSRNNQLIIIKNGDASPHDCTVIAQQTARAGDAVWPPLTNSNKVVTVPAGAIRVIGPLPSSFNDTNGNVTLNWSAGTSMTVGVVTLPS